MAIVDVLDVSYRSNPERISGRAIDTPKPESQSQEYAIDISGWVLGTKSPIIAVDVIHEHKLLQTVPLRLRRNDVTAAHPNAAGAETCGFQTTVGVLGLPPRFELVLRAVFAEESRTTFAVIEARHESITCDYEPQLVPLLLTSMGRVGSTWLMRLLAQHPRIASYPIFPYEIRTGAYWMHMLRVLSEPANHAQSRALQGFHNNLSSVGPNPFSGQPVKSNAELRSWFARAYPERLLAFCQSCVDDFYIQVAHQTGKSAPLYFIEKHQPSYVPWMVKEAYPRSREVFLVRDFRDMLCSTIAFNQKRGFAAFGRERAKSDLEHVHLLGLDAQQLRRSWKERASTAHLVRYEELVLHPTQTLKALLDYLDLDEAPSAIESMIENASEEGSAMREHRTSRDPVASVGRWQHDLDASLQAACHEAFGESLKEFGYNQ
jgi:hypothetical protein